MLRDVCDLLRQRGKMTTCDLAIHFDADESTMEGILQFLERKRRVCHDEVEMGKGCSACSMSGRCTDPDKKPRIRLWRAASPAASPPVDDKPYDGE